ncbi:glycosyltransferase [Agromyces sp. CFH 90414]|uniref:Glycosyltransferase n=1 Tax=Agromyces agglutinans TaxID=2662258 RepID=A0A6I2F8J1_9MICO|nr:glycosyltransferase [Agromyces agglutinans]MRG60097.1 glycosyltransferase [Agromyces agglutinans]
MTSEPTGRPRIAVLLAYEQDASRWIERFERGEVLDRTPYGYDLAASRFELAWSQSHAEGARARRIRRSLAARLGFDVVHAWRNRRMLAAADVIWTHTEREHLAVAAMHRMRSRRRRAKVIAQTIWLWDAWPELSRSRRRFTAWLLRTNDIEAVHSRVNLAVARTVSGRPVVLVPFGSANPFEPTAADGDLVLAVGNDRHRDWATLADAARRLPHLSFRVATSAAAAARVAWPENVEVRPAAGRAELELLYSRASVVVLPLRPNAHASGATSLIEAIAAGRRIITTRAGGIEEYGGRDARYVEPGDPTALAEAIHAGVEQGFQPADPAGLIERGLTQQDYVARYCLITDWLLLGGRVPPDASEFQSLSARPLTG